MRMKKDENCGAQYEQSHLDKLGMISGLLKAAFNISYPSVE
jgi:hypothetical protein